VREYLTRPLEFINEGNGIISLTSDDGEFPPEQNQFPGRKTPGAAKTDGAAVGVPDPNQPVPPVGKNRKGKKGGKGN
jgi:hypothetical protein